jgi:hypothetical protein
MGWKAIRRSHTSRTYRGKARLKSRRIHGSRAWGRREGRTGYGSYRVAHDAEALLRAAPKGVPGRGAFYERIRKELSRIYRYRAAHRAAWRTATVNAINAGFAVAGALQAWRRGTSVY